jgi:hypothetical protein
MSQPVTEISKPQNVTELYYVLIININKNTAPYRSNRIHIET